MIVTEEEAKTKWCPMVSNASGKNDWGHPNQTRCIASDCMMWQEATRPVVHPTGGVDPHAIVDHEPTGKGYCGLTKE